MSTSFEIYVFVLCAMVFIALGAAFTVMIVFITRLNIKLIRTGVEDEKIENEYAKSQLNKKTKIITILDKTFTYLICFIVITCFAIALYVNVKGNKVAGELPVVQVVKSASMSEKHEKNDHLEKYNLHDQIQSFDLIITHKLPGEFELELFDIVVYEIDNVLLVHRIVGIEEPNEEHPNERYFLLQGDAVETPDRFPVRYNQMKSIYKGERIPFVGSFVAFMQSPAGYLCILAVILTIVATPLVEKKLKKVKEERFILINESAQSEQIQPIQTDMVVVEQSLEQNEEIFEEKNAFDFGNGKTFFEKIAVGDSVLKQRYLGIFNYLMQIDGVRVIISKKFLTFKRKRTPIAKLAVKGKTLNAYIALNPNDYLESKYIFNDLSDKKSYANYPMRVKITSDRQVKWFKELVSEVLKEKEQ